MKLLLVFLSGCLAGCVSKGTVSTMNEGFDPFAKSTSLECVRWSDSEKVLRTSSVLFAGTPDDAWLINDVVLRTGEPSRFVATFPWNSTVRSSSLKERKAGTSSQNLGTITWQAQNLMAIFQPERREIELRDIQNNVIVKTLALNEQIQPIEGSLALVQDRWLWLTTKNNREESKDPSSQLELRRYDLASSPKNEKEPLKGEKANVPRNGRAPFLRLASNGQPLLIQLPADKSDQSLGGENSFSISMLSEKGAGKPQFLDLKVAAQVESFSASLMKDNILYVSYVDGDTLLGQAVLRVARISWQVDYARIDWQEEFNIKNLHASEPAWLSTQGDVAHLALPVWDAEHSRIMVYRVQVDGAKALGAHGEFPIGLRLLSAMSREKFEKIFGIVRYRSNESAETEVPSGASENFEICDFSKVMHEG